MPTEADTEFNPARLLAELDAHGVRFVVIGLLAAVFHGAQEATEDVDVAPDADVRNLARLAEALNDLGAVVLDEHGDPLPAAPIDDQHLRIAGVTHLRTRYGLLDVVINPAGARGYPDLVATATGMRLPGGVVVQVAALERIIESKRASDRPKDRAVIPRLEQLLRARPEVTDG